jgi:hypothetical protein
MAAGNTYVAIAKQTLSSTTSSLTFSSIPQTYTDLVLVVKASAVNATGNEPLFTVNGDSASNYSYVAIYGAGSSAGSTHITDRTKGELGLRSNSLSTTGGYISITNFMSYANTTAYKVIMTRSGDAAMGVELGTNLWRSTSAITSIELSISTTAVFAIGSEFSLYGIAAA